MEKKFIKGLLNKEEFKNISEKKLVEIINTLAEKEPEKIEALVSEFKKDLKYADGGKIAYLVSRMQDGGEIDYTEDPFEDDPFEDEDTWSEEFEGPALESSASSNRPEVVSRRQYRINMYNARQQHPDWTRGERKAWALTHTGKPEPIRYAENFDDTFDEEEEVEVNDTYTPKKASWSPYGQQRASQFGFKTEDELKQGQAANGLVADGKFGKNSEAKWRALKGGTTGSAASTRTGTTNTSQSTYWDARAKQFGFADSNAVKQGQAANGLVADGKFGASSEAKWRALNTPQSVQQDTQKGTREQFSFYDYLNELKDDYMDPITPYRSRADRLIAKLIMMERDAARKKQAEQQVKQVVESWMPTYIYNPSYYRK